MNNKLEAAINCGLLFIFIAMPINYDNKTFRSISNTDNGEVDGSTLFHYSQSGDIVTATYSGGGIKSGQLIAVVDESGILTMRYQHINQSGDFKYGHCTSTPEKMANGKLRLHEKWKWDCDDFSEGESIIEEV